jgi:hypothetical protein
LVRFDYSLNKLTEGDNGLRIFGPDADGDLRGGRPLDDKRRVAWFRFFNFPEITNDPNLKAKLQPARTIDTQISQGLGHLTPTVGAAPTGPTSLAERNLKRGKALGLPTGQRLAHAMGLPDELIITRQNPKTPFSIGTGYPDDVSVPSIPDDVKEELTATFGDHTPAWYYILKEAELLQQGQMLGPVGGRIVAEVFIGLLLNDAHSFLVSQPAFQPKGGQFGAPSDGEFGIVDLIRAVQDPMAND